MNTGKNEAINYELQQDIFICVSYFSWKESNRYLIGPGNKTTKNQSKIWIRGRNLSYWLLYVWLFESV